MLWCMDHALLKATEPKKQQQDIEREQRTNIKEITVKGYFTFIIM